MKDVILIGGGIMSANLGVMLKCLSPELEISLYEANSDVALEASNAWNNAGTGHAGICELYLTPLHANGKGVDVSKAITVFAQFERSLQFWGYAVREGIINAPRTFINAMPHLSFVKTQEQVDYLQERHRRMSAHHFFKEMQFTTDREQIGMWAPLLLEGRRDMTPLGASRMKEGTEVDFGTIARKLLNWLGRQPGCRILTSHRTTNLSEIPGGWRVTTKNLETGEIQTEQAKFVFVGAGGGSLPLLQKAGIPQSKGYGGFPVGGQWLVCKNPEVVEKHHSKIYGQAALGTTPAMALPHLDTRIIDGRRSILFGPFAKVTTRFLGQAGSILDLPRSVRPDNIGTLLHSGIHNLPLVKYMLQQGTQSMASRLNPLRSFYPDAQAADWELMDAGIRVQVIKKVNGRGSTIHYETEILTNDKRNISALLGASPGASISVHLMLGVIKKCLPHLLESAAGRERLEEMIPGHEMDLSKPEYAGFHRKIAARAAESLQLSTVGSPSPGLQEALATLIPS